MGRLRPPRRAVRDRRPACIPAVTTAQVDRQLPPRSSEAVRVLVRLVARVRDDRPRLLPLDAVDLAAGLRRLVRPAHATAARPIAELIAGAGGGGTHGRTARSRRRAGAGTDGRSRGRRALGRSSRAARVHRRPAPRVPRPNRPSTGARSWARPSRTRRSSTARSERGGFPVHRRPLRQWMFRITAYAERLLRRPRRWSTGPSRRARCSAAWIGRSEGAEIDFALIDAVATGSTLSACTRRGPTRSSAPRSWSSRRSTRSSTAVLADPAEGTDADAVRAYVEEPRATAADRSTAWPSRARRPASFSGLVRGESRHRRDASRSGSPTTS